MQTYSIRQLLDLRSHASRPIGIDAVVKIIQSSLSQAPAADKNRRHHPHRARKPPPLAATKMPLKTSKSEVLMLLNKLGGDQIADIGGKIYTIYTKSDEKEGLLTWIHAKTFEQRDLAQLFAEMWSCIFRRDMNQENQVRKLYLTLSAQRFRSLVFEDNEDSDDRILEVCEAMTAFKVAGLIDMRPIAEIVSKLVTQMSHRCFKGCAQGLEVITRGLPLKTLVAQTMAKMNSEQCAGYMTFLLGSTSADSYCTTVFPMILASAAQNVPSTDDLIRKMFLGTIPPRQDQVTLLLTLSKHSLEHELAGHLIALLRDDPKVIDAALVIFRLRGKRMPRHLIACMHKAADEYIASATSTPRLKFKFMDFKDLGL